MLISDENEYLEEQPIVKSNLASFFNNTTITKKYSPIDTELKTYFDISQMTLYDPNDSKYKTENLLTWWQLYSKTLPLLAQLARQYLLIPAISIARNVLTDKRQRLLLETVHDLEVDSSSTAESSGNSNIESDIDFVLVCLKFILYFRGLESFGDI
ncbi:23504_t:CDS:2, partial [Gigaspora rosea]